MAHPPKKERETISFRLDSKTKTRLDAIAAKLERDRSYVINEAVNRYLEVYTWQEVHIREGLEQARQGSLTPHNDVVKKWEARLANTEMDASR